AHAAGIAAVVVTNPDNQSGTLASGFTFQTPPAITSITPTFGLTAGGTAVTITGAGFLAGASTTLGDVAATNITLNSTTIQETTGAHAAGLADFVVINPNGVASPPLISGFEYKLTVPLPPVITSVTPNSGSTSGGTAVTILGSAFATGATVSIG